MQCGAAAATKLFDDVGPVGTVMMRLVFAAVVLMRDLATGRSAHCAAPTPPT